MKKSVSIIGFNIIMIILFSCNNFTKDENKLNILKEQTTLTASDILGNPNYLAISYGGYRHSDHSIEPTIDELKEDLKIMAAMGIKIIRTYKVHFPHASNILIAIRELKKQDANFEMYVMLGAWIDCKNAWTNKAPIHNEESPANAPEIAQVVTLANTYPDIVKVIAVGNEAMVKWATSYYVEPHIILKWVRHLQNLKKSGQLNKDLWITSSDNFASWGGGDTLYHNEDLNNLIDAVDYISLHTYPMHDTHYHPVFWGVREDESQLTDKEKIDEAMGRAKNYAMSQYNSVVDYVKSLKIDKPIHIGETGWASYSNGMYGPKGSRANDEYKQAVYYKQMREWTNKAGISCFFFEAFDEHWKDASNPGGSENHFGLFKMDGQAKFALWELVEKGTFNGLTRNGNPIIKSYNGDKEKLMKDVLVPISELSEVNH